jgi:hypothetical protein
MLERRGTSEANVPCARAAPSQCARMSIALVSPGAIGPARGTGKLGSARFQHGAECGPIGQQLGLTLRSESCQSRPRARPRPPRPRPPRLAPCFVPVDSSPGFLEFRLEIRPRACTNCRLIRSQVAHSMSTRAVRARSTIAAIVPTTGMQLRALACSTGPRTRDHG